MKTILIIREPDEFSRILTKHGFQVINLPLIETKPVEDLSEFEAKLENLKNYDGIFLTSRNAAQILIKKLREKNKNFAGKIYVLGGRSFNLLKAENFDLIFDENANTAREMLEKISPDELKNRRFLFVRGEKSLRVVPEFLEKIAAIDETVVYRTEKIAVEIDKIKTIGKMIKKAEVAAVCFFSPGAAESFLNQFGAAVLHQTRIATIGKTTADFFEKQHIKVDFISTKASSEDFAAGLIEYLGIDVTAKHAKLAKKE